MPKPIFTIGIPNNLISFSNSNIERAQEQLDKEYPDYHVLVYPFTGDNLELNAFYEKDLNEVKFEELKEFIRNQINSTDFKLPI